jgi:photosystem II stability/assembly factor-like uncharacterized protein
MKALCLIFLYIMIVSGQAQLPQAFIKKASIQQDDAEAFAVAVGEDGTVFVAYRDGLRAYRYDGHSFNLNAYIYNDVEGRDLAIDSDGTIFVAYMWDGLRAYTYDGSSFSNTAHIADQGEAHGVAIGPQGTIFVANGWDGLFAYTYDGSSFTKNASIHTDGNAHDVAVDQDGTVFVANDWGGGGLQAYIYVGSFFTHTATIIDAINGGAKKVEVDSTGTIFVGQGNDGLRAYHYNGSSFTRTALIDNGGEAWGIAINQEGTIFLANDDDGLRAYLLVDSSFLNTAHESEIHSARELAVGADGTIFVTSIGDGLLAYTYTGDADNPFFFTSPDYGFQNNNLNLSITGIKTHFAEGAGTSRVWMSRAGITIDALSYHVNNNTSIDAEFFIPSGTPIASWDLHIKTQFDSVITLENAVEIVIEGNYALQFDGLNDYIKMLHSESLNFPKELTFEAWIKPMSWLCNPRIFQKGEDDRLILEAESDGDPQSAYLEFGINGRDLEVDLPPLDKWTHVAAVYDGQYSKIYLNGYCQDSLYINAPPEATRENLFIGTRHEEASDCDFFDGKLDDIRFWNKAKSQKEIRTNMYRQLRGSEEGLVGYWPFNEGSGRVVYDLTNHENHGGIFGAQWVGASSPIGKRSLFCSPIHAYQNHNFFAKIQGANTHFSSGIQGIWLSKDEVVISADRFNHQNNTLLDAKFYIPPDISTGNWAIHVETTMDSIITLPSAVEILPPPSVTAQSSNTSYWLRSNYALNDKTCWAIGHEGIILKTTDGGVTWKIHNSNTSNVLYSTYFTNEHTGWAVGQYGTILKTTNGGMEWTEQESGTSNNLQSVCFADEQTGWTVGRLGTILKTEDGGLTWNTQPSGLNAWLYAVFFTDLNTGWVVGANGTILSTKDGGQTWESQNSGTSAYLSSIYFFDANSGWAVGSNGTIVKTVDGGSNWIEQNSETTEWLRSVHFKDLQMGWSVGTNGIMIMTKDGGNSWSTRKTWTNKNLSSIYFVDDITGWAIGESGTILSLKMNNLATVIEDELISARVPQRFQLFQNYPNPFNPTTAISYQLSAISDVKLEVYTILGQKVSTLVDKRQNAGQHQVEWDASGFASGVYYYKLTTGEFSDVNRMVLLR